MKRIYLFLIALVSLVPVSCERLSDAKREVEGSSDEIVFRVGGPAASASVETKATAVSATDLNAGFKVSCVKGSAGSDTEVWSNRSFTKDGDVWKGGSWWPLTDESYRFYAVYPSTYTMTYAAGGPTIAASTTHDIVAAYASAPTYKSSNTLSFDHIFARVKNMTVTATGGYTISNVTIYITPKVSGTYNLYTGHGQTNGTGWSSTATGSAVNLANATPGTKTNDLYLVPGTYTLTASWRAVKDQYTEDFESMTVDVALMGGKTNNISVNLTGNGTEIVLTVSVTDWSDNAVDGGTFPVVEPATFAGLEFAPGPLYYDGTEYVIFDDWNHSSFGSSYGKVTNSTFFSYVEMGELFEKEGYTLEDGSIDNLLDPFDGWRLPTQAEWATLTTGDYPGTSREGSTVNGVSGAKFAILQLSGVTHSDYSSPYGLLFFPDGKTITGMALSGINDMLEKTAGVSELALGTYLDQGCVFLPMSGEHVNDNFYNGGNRVYYWSSTKFGSGTSYGGIFLMLYGSDNGCDLTFQNYEQVSSQFRHCSVWLVR